MIKTRLAKKRQFFIFMVFVMLFTITACGEAEVLSNQTLSDDKITSPTVDVVASETVQKGTSPNTIGDWTLEDCQGTIGIYIAHEDGSFTKYYGGGYLDKNSAGNSQGMFLRNDIAENNSPIGKEDKLVVFCDSSYTLTLLPVKWEIGTIASSLADGTRAYIRPLNYDKYGVDFYMYYSGDSVRRDIMYIDGIPAKDYPFEIVEGGDGNSVGCGFPKDATVKLGVVDGTTLKEETHTVNATYYNCKVKRNSGLSSVEEHFLYPTPTSDGYAVIDIYDGFHETEVPAGQYVMELRMGRKYIAYLLNWQNS